MAPNTKPEMGGGGFLKGIGEGFAELVAGGRGLMQPILDALESIGNSAIDAGNLVKNMLGGTTESSKYYVASNTASDSAPVMNDAVQPGAASRAVEQEKYRPISTVLDHPLVEAEKSNSISLAYNNLSEVGKMPENGLPQVNNTLPALGGGRAAGVGATA